MGMMSLCEVGVSSGCGSHTVAANCIVSIIAHVPRTYNQFFG
jgi:hypothetical protein